MNYKFIALILVILSCHAFANIGLNLKECIDIYGKELESIRPFPSDHMRYSFEYLDLHVLCGIDKNGKVVEVMYQTKDMSDLTVKKVKELTDLNAPKTEWKEPIDSNGSVYTFSKDGNFFTSLFKHTLEIKLRARK